LAELAYEWNRLDEALAHARQSVELGRLWGNADSLGATYLTLTEVLLALGRLGEARTALHEAKHLSQHVTLFPAFPFLLRATQAQLWLKEGNLPRATQWADELTAGTRGTLDMKETLALAQVHLAVGRPVAALNTVRDLLGVARAQGLVSWLIRGLAVKALANHARGHKTQALNALAEAVTLAEPEGYARSFIDLGPAMVPLLQEVAAQGIVPEYVARLLSAFDHTDDDTTVPPAQPLVEPLSARELEVLALVAEGLSNREVGRRLHIAESTVKSHLNTIYGKLAVQNRTQAAAKARSLNLL
jgi:LuxR family maltose regulon positive regulatory protein